MTLLVGFRPKIKGIVHPKNEILSFSNTRARPQADAVQDCNSGLSCFKTLGLHQESSMEEDFTTLSYSEYSPAWRWVKNNYILYFGQVLLVSRATSSPTIIKFRWSMYFYCYVITVNLFLLASICVFYVTETKDEFPALAGQWRVYSIVFHSIGFSFSGRWELYGADESTHHMTDQRWRSAMMTLQLLVLFLPLLFKHLHAQKETSYLIPIGISGSV